MTVGQRIKEARKAKGWTQKQLGDAVGLSQPTVAEMEAGKLKNWPQHSKSLIRALEKPRAFFEPEEEHIGNTPDLPDLDPMQDYLPVEVLPTYAGMGGGGTGDAGDSVAMLPRTLVTHELRALPSDLLVINVRGDSMEPIFKHGDQLVIDRRDTNPRQPGPFALWYDDGYVVKMVEFVKRTGKYRIFSKNPDYSSEEASPAEVQIMGRPVWFARRL